MDFRHFELQDLLSEALIALEARDWTGAEAAVRKALGWVETDWLPTPSDLRVTRAAPKPEFPDRQDGE